MNTFVPQDQDARNRIDRDLDDTLLIEASAGTGKTYSLVQRVVALVRQGRAQMADIAAITFTEAAAAELRDRIRSGLEQAANDQRLGDEERSRCRAGAHDLDQAHIQTLHSFAGALLRERPLEAGLPPTFESFDAIQAQLAFEDRWSAWIDATLEDPALQPCLRRAITLGLTLAQLKDLALAFHENYDLLEGASFEDTPMGPPRVVGELRQAAPELQRLCRFATDGPDDPLAKHVDSLLALERRLGSGPSEDLSTWRVLARTPRLSSTASNQKNWEKDPVTEVNACKAIKDLLNDLQGQLVTDLKAARRAVLMPLLRSVRDFVLEYCQERKQQGIAEFHDLLVWARDLLRDNLDARDHFRRKFTHLLLDEFQDTDPLQAEIALFLAEDVPPGTPEAQRPRHWRDISPDKGKLFVVGDPKQSIYRFRRADVAVTRGLRDVLRVEPLALTQSFRSQEPVITWVNRLFEQWLDGIDGQVEYSPLMYRWAPGGDHDVSPAVYRLGDQMDLIAIGPVRRKEARSIASVLKGIGTGQWPVLDPQASEDSGEPRFRPATFGDVCILMPQRTSLRVLELALEQAAIPYRIEGASLVLATQEVRDLINCLRAIDDPADAIAVVAALRSPAFACSDVDLAAFVEAGGRFDYLALGNVTDGSVAEGLRELAGYHPKRLFSPPPALIEDFIRSRRLKEIALGGQRPRERWRRYDFVVEQARAFVQAGGQSLRQYLDWIATQMEARERAVESPAPESDEDAVRIMTVHGAKGLEFPIVLLTGLNSGLVHRRKAVVFGRNGARVEARVGSDHAPFETGGYGAAVDREKTAEEQERLRLLYVACTRARDHLILSLFRTAKDTSSPAAKMEAALEDQPDLWRPIPDIAWSEAQEQPRSEPLDHGKDTPEARQRWAEDRERALRRQARPPTVAATTLAREQKDEQEDVGQPWKRGRAGTNLGRAVHAVLQTIDLATGDGLADAAMAQATAEGIPHRVDDIARLAQQALASAVVKRAVAAQRHWRELPVSAPLDPGGLEGFLDLAFEEDGGLVIVDYKTDALESDAEIEQAMARYRLQAGAYALALQRATGRRVKEVVFLFLQPRKEVSLEDLEQLGREAAEAAQGYFAAWD